MTDRRKSWREIDQAKSKGGTRRPDETERNREKASKTHAYSSYKSQLDKLFTPGGAALPESMREKLGPASEESKAQRKALDALTKDPSEANLTALLATGGSLPADPRLVLRLVDAKDPQLVLVVLQHLAALVEDGARLSKPLLQQRLQAVLNQHDDEDIVAAVEALR